MSVARRRYAGLLGAAVLFCGGLAASDAACAQSREVLSDVPLIRAALDRALDTLPEGGSADWSNPANGHSGTIKVGSSSRNADGQVCRNYRRDWTFDGGKSSFEGLACMSSAGLWRVRNERNLGRERVATTGVASAQPAPPPAAAAPKPAPKPAAPAAAKPVAVAAAPKPKPAPAKPKAEPQVAVIPVAAGAPEVPLARLPTQSVIR